MNYKQNEKINQVKESTLVVGIDIGSTTQYARAFDWRGIELGKVFTFSNSREGFEAFKAWMQHLQDKYRKSDVIVGIEPTGHYWFDLGAYLEDEGILLVMVNPYAVKQTKELDDKAVVVYPYEWDCMSEKQRNKILSKKTVIMSGESGYACKYYEIIGNVNNLSDHDCAIIADGGNLCFGYRMEGQRIVVYTD